MEIPVITPRALVDLAIHGKPIALIDVRTPGEFREMHVAFAHNIPLDKLDPSAIMQGRNGTSGEPLYVVCRTGGRGQKACELFHSAGFTNVINVEGGTLACEQAGLPILRGRKSIPLDRQARIAGGLLGLVGIALGWFVHPAFLAIPALVCLELVFAGMTNKSGLSLLLAKMPWNRCADCAIAAFCCSSDGDHSAAVAGS